LTGGEYSDGSAESIPRLLGESSAIQPGACGHFASAHLVRTAARGTHNEHIGFLWPIDAVYCVLG